MTCTHASQCMMAACGVWCIECTRAATREWHCVIARSFAALFFDTGTTRTVLFKGQGCESMKGLLCVSLYSVSPLRTPQLQAVEHTRGDDGCAKVVPHLRGGRSQLQGLSFILDARLAQARVAV
jgi:hypothetical protein